MLFSVYLKHKFKTQHPKIVLLENEKKILQLSWASFKFDCVIMYSSRNKKLNYNIISAQSIKSPPIDFVDLYVHVYVSVAWRLIKYRNTYLLG